MKRYRATAMDLTRGPIPWPHVLIGSLEAQGWDFYELPMHRGVFAIEVSAKNETAARRQVELLVDGEGGLADLCRQLSPTHVPDIRLRLKRIPYD